MQNIIRTLIALSASMIFLAVPPLARAAADVIVIGTKIETADQTPAPVEAFAISNGVFSYVGSAAEARKLAGPATQILHVGDKRILPGLVDAHIHPLGIVDLDSCDLKSTPMALAAIADLVRDCLKRYHVPPGAWLSVAQWNLYNGNEADSDHPTLRAALDRAAPDNPVQLLGSDGHHGAFNSAALRLARGPDGKIIGLSRATLAGPFKAYRELVAVDADGEPSGGVNENARALLSSPALGLMDFEAVKKQPEKILQRLNSAGITAFVDAAAEPDYFAVYDILQQRGLLTAYATLAQFYDPSDNRKADGNVDYDRLVAQAVQVRDRYQNNPLIRADTIKLFADGVLEGNPLASPPTLPNSPSLTPYLQPIFGKDAQGRATFSGLYVDTASPTCIAARAAMPTTAAAIASFAKQNGFLPAQCLISSGNLQHERAVILEYVRRMHKAGLALHIHAIGDAAVRTALDALEAARADDPPDIPRRPDTLAHLQLVSPDDVARIGRDKLFLAMTYAWIYTDKEYDLSVIPFVQKVSGDTVTALHAPGSYYENQAYPVLAMKKAGATLVAGSDAPVETRDPRPFVNMQVAVLRARDGTPPLGMQHAITIRDAVLAYTINGAKSLGRDNQFGSIHVGKSADFIVLNQDILSIPAELIGATKVEQTWFRGKLVYRMNPESTTKP